VLDGIGWTVVGTYTVDSFGNVVVLSVVILGGEVGGVDIGRGEPRVGVGDGRPIQGGWPFTVVVCHTVWGPCGKFHGCWPFQPGSCVELFGGWFSVTVTMLTIVLNDVTGRGEYQPGSVVVTVYVTGTVV
jgi:hypothetical protein